MSEREKERQREREKERESSRGKQKFITIIHFSLNMSWISRNKRKNGNKYL